MLQLRPTFSESWYRVAPLKPKLRSGAQMSRQFFRGERWFVVRDPAGNQFHRLSDPAYRFVGLLDGRRTVAEAWDLVGGQLADDAPTQPEVIQILSQLYAANLLETDITPDATVLLRRHKQMVQRKLQGRLMNVLFPRMPIWDPDRFLQLWMPVARVLFSKFGAVVWCIVLAVALGMVLPQWNDLTIAAKHAVDLESNPENLVWLYLTFIFIKLIHELGHAFACRRFGGECHELGIMLLVIVPTPYVDASAAWSFANKWKRIFVGAAGMIVELFFASICAVVWHYTDPGVINQIAYNAMLIASVTTIVFNANPLLRYDGYYILSDFLEIPNLRQKSTEYGMGLIRRHIFRVKSQQPLPPVGQRILLLLYAVFSSIYRIFVGVMIVLLVVYKVPVLGVLMAIGGVASWLFVPIFQVGKYLLLSPDLHRKRIRATAITLVFAAAVIFVIGFIKVPTHLYFTGIVQPNNPKVAGREVSGRLRTAGDGRVTVINAHDGQNVQKDQIIVQLDNPELTEEVQATQAKIDEVNDTIRQARVVDRNKQEELEAQLINWQQRMTDLQQRVDDLAVRAPFDGTLVAPNLHEMADSIIPRGTEIGEVAVLNQLVIKGNIDQADAQLATQTLGLKVDVRLAGMVQMALPGGEVTFPPAAVDELDSPSLGTLGGGETAVDPRDPKGIKTTVPQFQARVILDNDDGIYYAGQRAYVRLTLESKPLAWQWTRRLWQLIESRDTGKWI